MHHRRRKVEYLSQSEGETEGRSDTDDERSRDASGAASKLSQDSNNNLLMNDRRKYAGLWTRVWSGMWMILGFVAIIYLGHVFILALIICLQVLMARELFELASHSQSARHPLPGFKILSWHFFCTAMVYLYGSFLQKQLMVSFTSDYDPLPFLTRLVLSFTQFHLIISYGMYIAGFVAFILGLKPGRYKYQFGQFAWIHMIIFVVFFQSSFFVANIFQGIIWFLLPCTLIIINDCSAYFFGFFFGRTPLIRLSPKKTWEGFMGASVTTVLAAFVLAGLMGRFTWLTCPRKDLSLGPLHCRVDPMFKPLPFQLPPSVRPLMPWWQSDSIQIMPFQKHALAFGVFASSIAPFGGFFASGFKRAFKIKDFGEIIPGHGGITDRMDCQIVMAVFSYIYYQSFIAPRTITVESVLSRVMKMELDQAKEVYVRIGNFLLSKGISLQDLHTSDPQLWS